MAEVFLRRLTRWQAETQREDLADLYVAAYQGVPGQEYGDRQAFLRQFADDVQRPGFEMVMAGSPDLVGCAYGFAAERSSTWWQDFLGGFPSELEELTASGQIFVLAEMMVLPSHQRQRVATRLQEHLLIRCTAARAVACVDLGNSPGRDMYRSWGWSPLGQVRPAAGTSPLDVWGKPTGR